ncbi:MAG TPA: alpha/beta hydrolase [Nevskiaceae bacterium]|nr:alpha/beta hydrolase [Nevskiaceae bacterium]
MSDKPVPEGQYVTCANGYRVHYLEAGPKDGQVVVFLHGSGNGGCGYSNFKRNYPALAQAGYRCLIPDLIGYGYSDKPDDVEYTLDFFVECVIQAMDQLGVKGFTPIGNSLGGAITLGLALKYPHRMNSIVMMAPGGVSDFPDYAAMPGMALMFKLFAAETPPDFATMKHFFQEAFTVDHSCVEDGLVRERQALMKLQNKQVIKTMKVPNMTARLGEIECRALTLWGMNEKMMPDNGIMRIAKGLKHGRMVLVPQCGHWVMIEHRDLFNRMVLDFLQNG